MTTKKLAGLVPALIVFAIAMTTAEARIAPATEFDRHASDGRGVVSSERPAVRVAGRTHHKRERRYHERPAIPKNYAGGCRGNTDLNCLASPELKAKAIEIVGACGSRVVSAVAQRGNKSNHPIGRAVDLVGNPGCIYAHLHGWPGGYSTDYARVRHVHISYNPGGQEWGLRFAHGGHSRRTRYAAAQ